MTLATISEVFGLERIEPEIETRQMCTGETVYLPSREPVRWRVQLETRRSRWKYTPSFLHDFDNWFAWQSTGDLPTVAIQPGDSLKFSDFLNTWRREWGHLDMEVGELICVDVRQSCYAQKVPRTHLELVESKP